ncbi:MAG TPA: fumarylacetoacetate hydrolase family protein [Ignavibacteriaceae bacterium]|nr:fumarylacetoacetate hydrolase family protein [Ignavibacteriaceae bacterium]
MKLVSFIDKKNGKERTGIFLNNRIFDIKKCGKKLGIKMPSKMNKILNAWEKLNGKIYKIEQSARKQKINEYFSKKEVKLLAPVPHPSSFRDGYAFRRHVETARRNRGLEMIPEFDQFPVFYFTNHNAIYGEGDIIVEEDHLKKLDFELEAAVVIGKRGRNIPVEHADEYIAGFTIMNDFSARFLQMEEMKLSLGPAKGKDFATSIGPFLVTPDELEEYKIETKCGNKYNLEMKAVHNGNLISSGNLKDMNWTFAQIISRASYGADLLPGDVIGSGTVGTGCYLELNGTKALEAKVKDEPFNPEWLNDGDTIELEITGLGKLKNRIVRSKNNISIQPKQI